MIKLLVWGVVAVALVLSPAVEAQHLFHYLLAVTVAALSARHLAHN